MVFGYCKSIRFATVWISRFEFFCSGYAYQLVLPQKKKNKTKLLGFLHFFV